MLSYTCSVWLYFSSFKKNSSKQTFNDSVISRRGHLLIRAEPHLCSNSLLKIMRAPKHYLELTPNSYQTERIQNHLEKITNAGHYR